MICPHQITWSTLQRHSKQIFSGKELRGYYSPNSYIHDSVSSVSDLYISLIGLLILLQENRWAERGRCRHKEYGECVSKSHH
jgi:hypothetical protein